MPWTLDQSNERFDRWSHTAIEADGTNNTDELEVASYNVITVQSVHASHDDTSTVTLQNTEDGTNFDSVSGATITTSGASGSGSIVVSPTNFRTIRLRITETDGNASATQTLYVTGRKSHP